MDRVGGRPLGKRKLANECFDEFIRAGLGLNQRNVL
jgi:hypothetical protein